MKHYVIGLGSYLVALPLYAALNTTGFYAGLSATGTQWDFDTDNNTSVQFIPKNFVGTELSSAGSSNFDDTLWDYSIEARAGAYFRWGQTSNWLTAIEIFGGPHNQTDVHHDNLAYAFPLPPNHEGVESANLDIIQTTEARFTYGAEIKQSYFFMNDCSAFVILGGLITAYDIGTDLFSTSDVFGLNIIASEWLITQLTGWRVGGGFEKFWGNQLSATLQVTYTGYETLHTSFEQTIADNDDFINGEYYVVTQDEITFNPSAIQASIGLNYYFTF